MLGVVLFELIDFAVVCFVAVGADGRGCVGLEVAARETPACLLSSSHVYSGRETKWISPPLADFPKRAQSHAGGTFRQPRRSPTHTATHEFVSRDLQVQSLVKSLERRVNDTYLMEELHTVAKRIRNHSSLFDGTPRRFLREGDLIKFSRTGRRTTYR